MKETILYAVESADGECGNLEEETLYKSKDDCEEALLRIIKEKEEENKRLFGNHDFSDPDVKECYGEYILPYKKVKQKKIVGNEFKEIDVWNRGLDSLWIKEYKLKEK